jgi:hypothetical protein
MRVGRGACDHEVDPDSPQSTVHSSQPEFPFRIEVRGSFPHRSAFQLLQARRLAAPPGSQARQPSLKGGRETLDGLSQLKTLRSGLMADSSILPYLV